MFFTLNKRVLADNEETYYYWLKESEEKVNGRFCRQELFALRDQIIKNETSIYLF